MRFKHKGFTLIELLVVITIMAIMALIALPNMSQWLAARRVAGQAEQVANLLRFARAEAVRLNAPVYVCPVKVKSDGKVHRYCENEDYSKGNGIAAYADIDSNGGYVEKDNVDIALRAVILNESKASALRYQAQSVPFIGDRAAVNMMGFLPNGNFGYNTTDLSVKNLVWGAGRVRISLNDAVDKDNLHTVSLLVGSNGRIDFCERNDEQLGCEAEKGK